MNLKNKFKFIKKQDKNKSTVVILVLLSLIVLTSFSVSKTFDNFYANDVLKSFDNTYYFGGWADIDSDYPDLRGSMDKLKKVKYVKDVFSTSESEYIVDVKKVGDKEIDGQVRLIGQTEEDLRKISNNKYKDKYSIICHKDFYPGIDHETNNWISRSKIISMNKYKDSTMKIQYKNLKSNEKFEDNLKIVEVLKNDINKVDENICYASRELMWEIYQKEFKEVNEDTLWEDFLVDYDINHYAEVEEEFKKLGYWVSNENFYDLEFSLFDNAYKLKKILSVVSIIIVGLFMLVFNKNRIKDKIKTYSILKTLGMNDKEYNNLLDLENVLLVVKSFLISLIIAIIIYLIKVIIRYFYPFFLMKINILFDWMSLIIYYLAVLILLCITNYIYFKKIKKKSIVENLGE